jgi:hypothetical protein
LQSRVRGMKTFGEYVTRVPNAASRIADARAMSEGRSADNSSLAVGGFPESNAPNEFTVALGVAVQASVTLGVSVPMW